MRRRARRFAIRRAASSVTRAHRPLTCSFSSRAARERSTAPSPDAEIVAPAVLGFEDVLQGTALRSTVRAVEPTVCFRIAADDFMTMVSDNVLLAQGLFALLLASDRPRLPFAPPSAMPPRITPSPGAAHAARLLRQDPLLSRATATQLLALTAVAPEVPLKAGTVLFDVGTPPAVYQIIQGEVLLEHPERSAVAPAGATIGVADTLAGTASGWRANGDAGRPRAAARSRGAVRGARRPR